MNARAPRLVASATRSGVTNGLKMSQKYRLELSHPGSEGIIAGHRRRCLQKLLRGGHVKQIYEMKGRGHSARAIARELGLARNTVLKYLNSPDSIVPKPRQPRGSKLDSQPGTSTSGCRRDWRTAWSCCGNSGPGVRWSYTILADYVRPRRRQLQATVRFETTPGEQAQVTGAAWPTSAPTAGSTASGCS